MNGYVLPLSDDHPEAPLSEPKRPSPNVDEREALDAYSRVIVTVAEKLGPAVVNLRAVTGESGKQLGRIGFGIPDHPRWLSADQSSRRARLQPDAGSLERRSRSLRPRHRRRPLDRRRRRASRSLGPSSRPARRIRRSARRPARGRHRQPVRLRFNRHRRRHQRPRPHPAQHHRPLGRQRHPDRCCTQPRQ